MRYSVDHPMAYLDSNLAGMLTVLEGCRHGGVKHLVYASSSSIYGAAREMPLREDMVTDSPISLYAASKKANELMAHSYSHLYGIPASALRFFTVYGPWGRPDMAIFKFVRAIFEGKPIDVYNHGHLRRDFTYVDDVVDSVMAVAAQPPQRADGRAPHRVLNVGHNGPVPLMDFIGCLEQACGRAAIKNYLPMQPGDVPDTWADTTRLEAGLRRARRHRPANRCAALRGLVQVVLRAALSFGSASHQPVRVTDRSRSRRSKGCGSADGRRAGFA